jgi:hypothetical protein
MSHSGGRVGTVFDVCLLFAQAAVVSRPSGHGQASASMAATPIIMLFSDASYIKKVGLGILDVNNPIQMTQISPASL